MAMRLIKIKPVDDKALAIVSGILDKAEIRYSVYMGNTVLIRPSKGKRDAMINKLFGLMPKLRFNDVKVIQKIFSSRPKHDAVFLAKISRLEQEKAALAKELEDCKKAK